MSLFKRLFGFMVLKCVWNNIEVAAFVGSVSFRKTTLTGMSYEVPAFAGIGVRSLLIPKIYKDKK
jgi:hypothetical protein